MVFKLLFTECDIYPTARMPYSSYPSFCHKNPNGDISGTKKSYRRPVGFKMTGIWGAFQISAWVIWPERPKERKDKVKEARRAQNQCEGVQSRENSSFLIILINSLRCGRSPELHSLPNQDYQGSPVQKVVGKVVRISSGPSGSSFQTSIIRVWGFGSL